MLWVIGPIMARAALWTMNPNDPRWRSPHPTDAIAVASILLSLALFFYARRTDRDPQFILDLGLGYMVLSALGVGWSCTGSPCRRASRRSR